MERGRGDGRGAMERDVRRVVKFELRFGYGCVVYRNGLCE